MKTIMQHHFICYLMALAAVHFDPPRIIVYNMGGINYKSNHDLKLWSSILLHDGGADLWLNDDSGLRLSPKSWCLLLVFCCVLLSSDCL